MATRTPEPRLPLEPEEYPLYKPPSRVGCSALTIITLLTLGVFFFLLWRVTPSIANNIINVPLGLVKPFTTTTPDAGATADTGTSTFPTQTAVAGQGALSAKGTTTPQARSSATAQIAQATTTPANIEYVEATQRFGFLPLLRSQPTQQSPDGERIAQGVKFQIIGPDEKDTDGNKNRNGELYTYRHVRRISDGKEGYIVSDYLISSTAP